AAHEKHRLLFFFQAEDGIRDGHVTGVQTCALPILAGMIIALPPAEQIRSAGGKAIIIPADVTQRQAVLKSVERASAELGPITAQIGRASCRERVMISGGGVWWQESVGLMWKRLGRK